MAEQVFHCPICGIYCGSFISVAQSHVAYEHPGMEIPKREELIAFAAELRRTRKLASALEALAGE